jgi:lipopolysaccharide export system permease protein
MRLLDRYLLRELLIPLCYCLGGFLIFWIAGDLFNQLGSFKSHRLLPGDVAEYYLVKAPEFLVLVTPIALLLALLYALSSHARYNELTAIRTAGVSLWRTCVPYLVVGLCFGLGSFAAGEFWVPNSSDLANQILARRLDATGSAKDKDVQTNAHFKNARDRRIWEIDAYNFRTHVMTRPKVTTILPDGSSQWLTAELAMRVGGVWTFYDVERFEFKPGEGAVSKLTLKTNVLAVPEFTETPERINRELRINRRLSVRAARATELSIAEVLDYLRLHRDDLTPRDAWWLWTQLQEQIAAPWTCVVVVLIAVPFGATTGRRNVFAGVASGIVICFAYFILLRLGLALGSGGLLPAWVAAWLPNVSFALVGLWMLRRAA